MGTSLAARTQPVSGFARSRGRPAAGGNEAAQPRDSRIRRMQIGLLGALEIRSGGQVVPVAGGRLLTLLARLALDAGRPVRRDALIDAVWDDAPPADAGHALQALVSRLRRAVGAGDWITSSSAGYTL